MYGRRRREKTYYRYECTLTAKSYRLTQECKDPSNLVSIEGYYQLHPELDDRPAVVKKKLGIAAAAAAANPSSTDGGSSHH
jgi:hypothetical protein